MKKVLFLLLLVGCHAFSQQAFTRRDSLHGSLRSERTCFDVKRYDLSIKVDINAKYISGYNDISFDVLESTPTIQVDLFANMQIDSIVCNSKKLKYRREFDAVFVSFPNLLPKDSHQNLRFYYSGNPLIAKKAPWDGGFVFTKDGTGKDWVAVAVQGTGASLWYPCKDSQTDEPDLGATIKIAAPNGLMDISNGRLTGNADLGNGYTRWDWEVKNPINNYNITLNIGDYVVLSENYKGLDVTYCVLRENKDRALKHFEEVKPMLDCYQAKFGPYPFAEDGYKLVEAPYLGMEHQSAVAWGNQYRMGYFGSDLSGTGVGMLFDFMTIHESGHEWFGNSITSADIADMWIHEGFTCYTESVYLECVFGLEKSQTYINGLRKNISNDRPVIGTYGVNNEGSTDMYYKGALMLNTIRHIIDDDQKWWSLIYDYATTFRHKIIDTQTVVDFFNSKSGLDLTPVFNQYLRYTGFPVLELRKKGRKFEYRWKSAVSDFNMPVDVTVDNKTIRLQPQTAWTCSKVKVKSLSDIIVAKDKFLIDVALLENYACGFLTAFAAALIVSFLRIFPVSVSRNFDR